MNPTAPIEEIAMAVRRDASLLAAKVNASLTLIAHFRQTACVSSMVDGVPDVLVTRSPQELAAYNGALEFYRLYIAGEFDLDHRVINDNDLPGPDLAVRYPTPPDPAGPTAPYRAPAPVMQSCGELFTSR